MRRKKGDKLFTTVLVVKCNVSAQNLEAAMQRTRDEFVQLGAMMEDDIGMDTYSVIYAAQRPRLKGNSR
jgi:hypothetical protein